MAGSALGHAHPALSSKRIAARLDWRGGVVWLRDADGAVLASGPVQRIERMPGGPAQVHLPDGWLFETDADLNGLPGARPDRWLSRLEAWHPRLAAVALICLLAAVALWRWGLDLLVALAMAVTPDAPVRAMDGGNMVMIDQVLAEQTQLDLDRQLQVLAIFDGLVRHAPPAPWGEYRLLFRDIPAMGPNAFAMPGGTIVITDQLIQQFEDDDVIAAVLGHEIAHVSERHVLAQLYRAGSIYLLVTLIAGDPGPVLQDFLREGNALLALSYSRGQEAEADRLGVATANAAGHDGAALAEFFDALLDEIGEDELGWLSSHPALADRAAQIRGMAGGTD